MDNRRLIRASKSRVDRESRPSCVAGIGNLTRAGACECNPQATATKCHTGCWTQVSNRQI
jgi:hypothetical protein